METVERVVCFGKEENLHHVCVQRREEKLSTNRALCTPRLTTKNHRAAGICVHDQDGQMRASVPRGMSRSYSRQSSPGLTDPDQGHHRCRRGYPTSWINKPQLGVQANSQIVTYERKKNGKISRQEASTISDQLPSFTAPTLPVTADITSIMPHFEICPYQNPLICAEMNPPAIASNPKPRMYPTGSLADALEHGPEVLEV